MDDGIEVFLERYVGLILLVIVGLVMWGIWLSVKHSVREREAACAHLWQISRTHDDTVKITMRCELGDESTTTVVPMPIFIPTR
jgi:hypothetical protein